MAMSDFARPAPFGATVIARIAGAFERIVEAYRAWRTAETAADELHKLSDRELADIGLIRGDIDVVAEKLATR
ncbi:MAG: DUF1127 domain-containing protein [Pseudomonadota bacterium]